MIIAVLRKSRIMGSTGVIERIAAGAAGPGSCGPASEPHQLTHLQNHM